jgi:hypothetical protein
MTDLTARIAVSPKSNLKATILASRAVRWQGFDQKFALVQAWIDDAWEEAKLAGLVTEAMLGPTAESASAETIHAPGAQA